MTHLTQSAQETENLACEIAKSLKAGSFVSLTGDLGAGKTAFTRGLVKGLGSSERVLSPTFTIQRVYSNGRLPIYHFDAYRITDSQELDEIGFWDCVQAEDGVVVCEWADQLEDWLPADRLNVHIETVDETTRRITITENKS